MEFVNDLMMSDADGCVPIFFYETKSFTFLKRMIIRAYEMTVTIEAVPNQ